MRFTTDKHLTAFISFPVNAPVGATISAEDEGGRPIQGFEGIAIIRDGMRSVAAYFVSPHAGGQPAVLFHVGDPYVHVVANGNGPLQFAVSRQFPADAATARITLLRLAD